MHLSHSAAYSEHNRTSTMGLSRENSHWLEAVNYFRNIASLSTLSHMNDGSFLQK